MEAAGADFDEMKRAEFYTSHEALLMDYERPMTRIDSRNGTPDALSSHFVWIGERTRDLDGAHVDFLSRVRNPIGVKLGPTQPRRAERLIDKLDPEREPGRLTFITRMGAGKIRDALPPLLEAIKGADATPLWVSDPMHGNGMTTPSGYKTRRFEEIVDEVHGFFEAHRDPARTRAASTSSSPATTSPSASAARSTSTRPPSRRATRGSATRV